jgi:thioredoxin reductase
MALFDVIIVGAGPAGLSAALVLGRCRRRVLLCDTVHPRNAASHALHGFLSRDGIQPGELLRLGREQLCKYESVELHTLQVFKVTFEDGRQISSRKLLLATGIVDELPAIEGVEVFYGRSVFHCPYCDGWEVRDAPLAIYGQGERGQQLALELTVWSRDLVLCTDGPSQIDEPGLKELSRHGIAVREERILRLEGKDGVLERLVFITGAELERRALFLCVHERQHSDLAAKLGCAFTKRGTVRTGEYEQTNIPGLYVAGDASRRVQMAIVAAAEGAEAAFAMNIALLKEDLARGMD